MRFTVPPLPWIDGCVGYLAIRTQAAEPALIPVYVAGDGDYQGSRSKTSVFL
jgi:hypothetical protein